MSSLKLFYHVNSYIDQDKNIPEIYMKRPKIMGVVENACGEVRMADKLKYFHEPRDFPLDLNVGYDQYKHRSDGFKWKLNKVSGYLINRHDHNENNFELKGRSGVYELDDESYEVVTHRGTLTLLMQAPYSANSNYGSQKWKIHATHFNKKLYLIGDRIDENCNSNMKLHQSYHYKFEQYCFSNEPNKKPDTSAPINEEDQTFCIYHSQLKNIKFIYSAEVHGVLSDQKIENMEDLEALGKCRFVHTKLIPDRVRNLKKQPRALRWWIMSYLTGVEDLFVGFKTKEGLVERPLVHLHINQLPINQNWSPKVCVNFLYKFIEMVMEEMRGVDSPDTCFEFNFDPENCCINYRIHEGKTEHSFLTEDFVEYIKNAVI